MPANSPVVALPEKLRVRLLKLRKGATAGFGPADWEAVLTHLGFEYEVTEKDGRRVEAVRITAPNGATLDVKKEANYRHIVFYGIDTGDPADVRGTTLAGWAKARGYDLSDLASGALGMDTVDFERARRGYYERDYTHTGTCGVCEQNVKMTKGTEKLVHHGYQRPGDGYIRGDCFGVAYPPHELAPDAARAFLSIALRPALAGAQQYLFNLETGKVTELSVGYGVQTRMVTPESPSWEDVLAGAKREMARKVESLAESVAYFEKKVAEWKLDELPQVKMERLYGPKPEEAR